jgi:hypothetical protein
MAVLLVGYWVKLKADIWAENLEQKLDEPKAALLVLNWVEWMDD